MTKAIRIHRYGDADMLISENIDLPAPEPGEVRLRHTAAGVNFVDVYHRTGLYPLPALPSVLGVEGAGVVEAVGAGVEGLQLGDRVAYAADVGGYAEARLIPAGRLIRLPDAVSDQAAAATMLRGITAHMLLNRTYPVTAGTTILVHAAAGGLGLLVTQWAKRLGATVIGTVGNADKEKLALDHGLDHAIRYRDSDFVAAVRDITAGRGVDFAIDGIGGDTLTRTFDAMRTFGTVASIGQAGGPIPAIAVTDLGPRRSLSLARPSVFAYAREPVAYREAAAALFALHTSGPKVEQGAVYPLEEAAQAHRDLEAGRTAGSPLLIP